MNRVILRDANLLLDTDSFSKDLTGYIVAALIDIFSSYD